MQSLHANGTRLAKLTIRENRPPALELFLFLSIFFPFQEFTSRTVKIRSSFFRVVNIPSHEIPSSQIMTSQVGIQRVCTRRQGFPPASLFLRCFDSLVRI